MDRMPLVRHDNRHAMSRSGSRARSANAEASLLSKIGRVAAASAAAQFVGEGVSLVQTIALARILTPTEVGYFAAGSVLTSFVGNFVEGGLRSGLIHRERDLDDASETVFRATLAMGVLMSLLALAAAPVIGLVFDSRTAGLVAASMSGGVLLYSLTNVPEALLQREFNVRRRLFVGPAVAISFAVVAVTLAVLGFGVWSMVAGSYASSIVWVISVWWISGWRPGGGRASFAIWRDLARFGFPLALGMLGDRTQKVAQAMITGAALGPSGLGLLRYGDRIARIPVNAIVEVSSNSLFPAFTRIANDADRLRTAYLRALSLHAIAASAVSALMIAVGEPLVVIVLGEKWRGAGVVLVTMAGLVLGKAFMTVSEEAIKGIGRTRVLNWLTATEGILSIGLLLLLIRGSGLVGVGLSISVTALMTSVLVLGLAMPLVDVSLRKISSVIFPPVLSGLVGLAAVGPLEHLVLHSDTRGVWVGLGLLCADGVAFLVVYAAALWCCAPDSLKETIALVRHLIEGTRRRPESTWHGEPSGDATREDVQSPGHER